MQWYNRIPLTHFLYCPLFTPQKSVYLLRCRIKTLGLDYINFSLSIQCALVLNFAVSVDEHEVRLAIDMTAAFYTSFFLELFLHKESLLDSFGHWNFSRTSCKAERSTV